MKKTSQLTLFAEDFPARTSPLREKERELRASAADYGQNTPELLANYDPNTQSWRTSQHCLVEGLTEFSETWPRSGMMRNGIAYQLQPLVTPKEGTESGLLPTLVAGEWKGTSRHRYIGSTKYRGAKMSEGLRNGENDPTYLHPTFAEAVMGFPTGWTDLNN